MTAELSYYRLVKVLVARRIVNTYGRFFSSRLFKKIAGPLIRRTNSKSHVSVF